MRWLVAIALAASCGKQTKVIEPDAEDPDDEDAASPCKSTTEDDLAQAEMLGLGGHLHRGLALAEAADRRCSTAGSRWMVGEFLAELGADARAIAAFERFAREARTARGKTAAAEKIEELRKRPPPARPDASDDDRETALLLYRDGVNLRLGKKYDDAVRQLRRSYALQPHPLTIAQIALAHEDAGRTVDARKAHERALAIAEQLAGRRAVPRLLRGHVARAVAVAWSRDGRRVVTAGEDDQVKVWEPTTARVLHSFALPRPAAVAISADGGVVAGVGTEGEVRVWDGVSGALRSAFPEQRSWRVAVALSADGTVVAAGGDAGVQVRLTTGQPIGEIARGGTSLNLRFLPDGAGLLITAGTQIEVWAPAGGVAPLWRLEHGEPITTADPTPDGKRLAVADGTGTLAIYDLASRRRVHTTKHGALVTDVAWSGDGQVLATSGAGRIKIWDGRSLELRRELAARAPQVALSADGATLAGSGADPVVRTWELAGGNSLRPLGTEIDPITGVGFSADGRLLVTAGSRAVDLWRLDAVREPRRIDPQLGDERLDGLAVDPHGRWIAIAGRAGTGALFDAVRGSRRASWQDTRGLAPRPDGLAVAAVGRARVQVWDTVAARKLSGSTLSGEHSYQAVAWSPDGGQMIFAGFPDLWVQNAEGRYRWDTKVTWTVQAIAWAPVADVIVTGHMDGKLTVWNAAELHRPPQVLAAHDGPVLALGWSPDRTTLASAGADGRIRLWDRATRQPRGELVGHVGRVLAVAFAPGGRVLASGGDDGVVMLWDLTAGTRLATITPGEQWLVLAEDGRIDGAQGRSGGAGLVYWQVGATPLPGVTGWDRAHTPGLLRDLFGPATGKSPTGRSTATGR